MKNLRNSMYFPKEHSSMFPRAFLLIYLYNFYANDQWQKMITQWEDRKNKSNNEDNEADTQVEQTPAIGNLIRIGNIFGELGNINKKKWPGGTVFALEPSSVLVFSLPIINQIIKDLSSTSEYQELLRFLCEVFTDFARLALADKRKIIDCFHFKEFNPGQYLIREGEIGTEAYLIKEGECYLQSKKNPLVLSHEEQADPSMKVDTIFRPKRGFWSQTINALHFGILEKRQWVGEERLIAQAPEPPTYSVIAGTKVIGYAISREEAEKKLPKVLVRFLERLVGEKTKWIQQRTKTLVETSKVVAKLDPSKEKYDEKLDRIMKKFPSALPHAVKSIRKIQVLTKLQNASNVSSAPRNSSLPPPHYKPPTVIKPCGVIPGVHKMSNATSASKLVSLTHLVPIMAKSAANKSMSRLANIGLNSFLTSGYEDIVRKEETVKASHFTVGSRKILPQTEEEEEERPPTTNPYSVFIAMGKKTTPRPKHYSHI